ncbi:MAG: alpha/beta fold hydrolase [Dehalococcoidales bacterium]|nr:MAG: alpha/beta fold hydrolase [Dehalococcoidales bacterium]
MTKKILRLTVCSFLVLIVLLASCSKKDTENEVENTDTVESTGQSQSIPEYETVDCPFTVPQGTEVECGCMTVPENRNQPDGNQVSIQFAIFRSKSRDPEPDPIVYLAGGPGEHALESVSLTFDKRFAPLTENRDLIVFDQRGTGYSEPALECPELIDLAYELLDQDLESEEAITLENEATRECYERLNEQGIDLSSYNSVESAADLNDLRLALGYDEWNLFGISYGTRLALTAMRDYPDGIRSVILNSTVPLQADLYSEMPAAFDRALNVLFGSCAGDPEANKAYPDLRKVFFETIDQLNDSPAEFTAIHPLNGESYDVLMSGNNFFNFVISTLYSTEVIPLVPKVIFDTHTGNYDTLALLVGSNLLNMELRSSGMHYSVQCNEELPFTTQEDITASLEEYTEIREYLEDSLEESSLAICEYWTGTTPDPVENEPVHSDIPTLILSGEFDPITPPAWGRLAAETLTNSWFIEFPGLSHDVLVSGNECPLDIALEFLDNPHSEPGRTCLAEVESPDYVVLDVNLVPFTNILFGIKGIIPENWSEITPGVYSRSELGITVIGQQAIPGMDADTILGMLSGSFGIDEDAEKSLNRKANGLEWTIYQEEILGMAISIALAEGDGITYFILFTCVPNDHPFYYDNLLIPVIDEFRPLD